MSLQTDPGDASFETTLGEGMRMLVERRQRPLEPGTEALHREVLRALLVSHTTETGGFRITSIGDRFSSVCLITTPAFCSGGTDYKYISVETGERRFDVIFDTTFKSHHPMMLQMVAAVAPGEITGCGGGYARISSDNGEPELALYDESSDLGPTNIPTAQRSFVNSGLIDECIRHYGAV